MSRIEKLEHNLDELECKLDEAMKIVEAYESFEADVAHAMHKVGWDNSGIENAYDELQEKLLEINREV